MNEELFAELTSQIKVGKHLPDAIYLHKDAFSVLPKVLTQFIPAVEIHGQAVLGQAIRPTREFGDGTYEIRRTAETIEIDVLLKE